jgi:hypothetical protein
VENQLVAKHRLTVSPLAMVVPHRRVMAVRIFPRGYIKSLVNKHPPLIGKGPDPPPARFQNAMLCRDPTSTSAFMAGGRHAGYPAARPVVIPLFMGVWALAKKPFQ